MTWLHGRGWAQRNLASWARRCQSISSAMRHLTVDLSGLAFADWDSIQALVLAARALQERSGDIILPSRSRSWPGC